MASNKATGIVSAIRTTSTGASCTILSKRGPVVAESTLPIALLDLVQTRDTNGKVLVSKLVGKADMQSYEEALSAVIKKLKMGSRKTRKFRVGWFGPITARMHGDLLIAGDRLARSLFTGAPVVVRFHNDCDGASGAVALYRAFGKAIKSDPVVYWRINHSIAYLMDSFRLDSMTFSNNSSVEKPVVLITDFGTSPESEPAIAASAEISDFVWLDHHPPYDSFPKKEIGIYINPWDHGGTSDYTAGFLASTLAELFSGINASLLKKASLISDYSIYGNRDDKAATEVAMFLDYITSRRESSGAVTPKMMEAVLSDPKKLAEESRYASRLMEEALEEGVKRVRHYKSKFNVNIFLLDFEGMKNMEANYPLPGRYSSRLQGKLEELHGNRTMVMVRHGVTISVRATRQVADEIDLLKVANELRDSSGAVSSAGGHRQALAIRFHYDRADEGTKLLLHALGA